MQEAELSRRHLLVLLLPSIAGMFLLLYSTRWGIGVSIDSVAYLSAAHHFAQGHGISEETLSGDFLPLRAHPPMMPFVTGMLELAGLRPSGALRWLNAFLLAGAVLLIEFLLWRETRSFAVSVIAGVLAAGGLIVQLIHAYAWSEPLCLLFIVATWIVLLSYLDRPGPLLLAASSLLTAAALLTRYAAVSLVFTGSAGIVLLSQQTLFRRLRDAFLYGVVACAPLAAWLLLTRWSGTPVYGASRFHRVTFEHLNTALYSVSVWLVPEAVPGAVKKIALGAALLLFLFLIYRFLNGQKKKITLPALLALFIVFYLGVVGYSISSYWQLWEKSPVDTRILCPVFLASVILVAYMAQRSLVVDERSRLIRLPVTLLIFLLVTSYVVQAIGWGIQTHETGLGYASRAWQESQVIRLAREVSPDSALFSNRPVLLRFLTGRQVAALSSLKNESSANIDQTMVVFLYDDLDMKGAISERDLGSAVPLKLLARSAEGAIYVVERAPSGVR